MIIVPEESDVVELAALFALVVAVVIAVRGPGTSLIGFRTRAGSRPR